MRTDRYTSYAERMDAPRGYPDIDYDHAVGGRYFPSSQYRGAEYRVYESGMVRMYTGVENSPDRRADFERIFGVQCKRLPEIKGKLFTPDGRRVHKTQVAHLHLWIDGDVAVACEKFDNNKVPNYEGLRLDTRRGYTPSYVIYTTPDALPQSNNDIITLWPDKDKLAIVAAAIKQLEAEGLVAMGVMLDKFPHDVPESWNRPASVTVTGGHLLGMALKNDYRRFVDDPKFREGYATAVAAMVTTAWGAGFRKEWERQYCIRAERHYWLRWEE